MGRPLPGHSSLEDKEVLLGMPGAWADEINELADHYTTKVGGQPDWPAPLKPLIKSDQLKCAVCGGYLCLVAQVHAPLTSDGLNYPERTLYILGCPTKGCGVSHLRDELVKSFLAETRKLRTNVLYGNLSFYLGRSLSRVQVLTDTAWAMVCSWRTIRVQKNSSKDTPPEPEISADRQESNPSLGTGAPDPVDLEGEGTSSRQDEANRAQGDGWWDDTVWDGTPAEESSHAEVDSLNLQDLQSSLTEAAQLAASVSGPENSSNAGRITGVQRNPGTSAQSGPNHSLPVISCFYIYCQAESSPGGGSSASDTDRTQTLGENDDPGSGGSDGGEIWGSEEYEPDQALYADRTYLKFKKKLDCYPEQCFRYSFAGEPLYATDEHRDPANCAVCGGPRVFEMQLMPPLLYYLQQAHKDLPSSVYGPEDWDWHTLLVFSCAQSCRQEESEQLLVLGEKTDWSFIEEVTILQQDLSAAFVR